MAPETKRPLKVFLCHASGDKPPVRDLYKRLTIEGVDAWLDKEKLLPGQDWQAEIPRAVREADVVVVCLSNKSITKEGYVQKEIKFALDIAEEKPEGAIFLIPARLEDCPVPERLSRWQWVDLYEENGFVQLLRSLKLRAKAVGALIEAVSYEDTDKERERRLNQLYTEGLEAFYIEDWDRACRCFQAILSEQPKHRNAAEKLEEAQCQGHYAKLYAQASEAYRSENWIVAITTLDELSQKAPNYKDVVRLLRDARKREQLAALYGEAKTLHAAQKWQAVVKVFEQISILEPNYPDDEGLLTSAQKEVAELKRLADLNEQYSQALHEMESANWYEARKLLESIHKSQTGFLETEKLLRKVEAEILKEEEKRKQNDQINILYEQAHGLLRSKKWRNALEKLEEIWRLEEHFPDPDGIAEKAQTELEHEEQELERQNKLAAVYAEAVRLLKEEKYQEALDQLLEVRAIDPKYPDRQGVQKTASKKLIVSTEPVQIKSRFILTKPLQISFACFILFAVVITGILLFMNGNGIIFPSQTSASTMYDDFNDSAFNGKINTDKWNYAGDVGKISQENGMLGLTVYGFNKIMNLVFKKDINPVTVPTFVEGRMMLDPNTTKEGTDFGVGYSILDGWSNCSIYAGQNTQQIRCWSHYYGIDQRDYVIDIPPGTWHTLRVESFPDTMTFNYIVDGNRIGSYTPSDPNVLKGQRYTPRFYFHNFGYSALSPVCYIDYAKLGNIGK